MSTTVRTAAVPTPRLPSISEIEKAMREQLPGLTIYNPSPDWVLLEIFGLTHLYACPDLGGEVQPHPVTEVPVKCDGRTMVRGRFLKDKDSSGKVIEGQDAPAMVKLIISPEKYGQMGFVWLPGISAAADADLIKRARGVYMEFQRQTDEMIVNKRVEFKANWSKSGLHKGEPCPPPTPAEQAAMDRLQERKRAAVYKYECPIADCATGYATNDKEKFARHLAQVHNQKKVDWEKFDGSQVETLAEKVGEGEDKDEEGEQGGIAAAAADLAPVPSPEPDEEDEDRPVKKGSSPSSSRKR